MVEYWITDIAAATLLIIIIASTAKYVHERNSKGKLAKLPPGPAGLPILGNTLQFPSKHLGTYSRSLFKQYGNFVSLQVFGSPWIFIGDMGLAKTILAKHSIKHSSRATPYYFSTHVDSMHILWALRKEVTVPRKLATGVMSSVRIGRTELLQEFEALVNVKHLLDDSGENWYHHMERVATSTVLSTAFGKHYTTGYEADFQTLLKVFRDGVELGNPSASIVNLLPILDYIPGPMPWRIRAESFKQLQQTIFGELFEHALKGNASGVNTWAAVFASEDQEGGDQRHLLIQFTQAAIETTTSMLQSFVLASILYPEWVVAAQEEIDRVVGPNRLPCFKDRPFLPYIEAVVRETLRWRPALRFGLPHGSTQDDIVEYQGQQYCIPKGSTIVAVTWAIEHDESKYEDHDRFIPERFLDSEGKLKLDYETSAFGFGRRVCPGIPFAERTLWINIATMLWTFNIRPSNKPDPKTGLPHVYDDSDQGYLGEFSSPPVAFPAIFEPRDPKRAEVARREWSECEKDLHNLLQ